MSESLSEIKSRSMSSMRRTPTPTQAEKDNKKLNDAQLAATESTSVDQTNAIENSSDGVVNQLRTIETVQQSTTQGINQLVDVSEEISQINDEQLESLRDLSGISSELSNKLINFSEMLKQKQPEIKPETTSTILLGPEKPEVKSDEPPKVIEDKEKPSNELVTKGTEIASDVVKGAPAKLNPVGLAMTGIGVIAKEGFKKTVGVMDKIAGTLFKFTVSRALEAAKMAAMIFGLILAIDVIKIMWAKWGDDVMKKLNEWGDMFNQWWTEFKTWSNYFSDFSSVFDSMAGDWTALRDAWENGDWPALAKAIGVAFLDGITTLAATLQRIISKLGSEILRAFGFNDTADYVEAKGLENYQRTTGNELNPENAAKVAKMQQKRESESPSLLNGIDNFVLGFQHKERRHEGERELKNWFWGNPNDKKEYSDMSPQDQQKVIAAKNEASYAIERVTNYSNRVDVNKPSNQQKYSDLQKSAQNLINSSDLNNTPELKKSLQKQLDDEIKSKITPSSSAESKDVQVVNSIKQNEQKSPAQPIQQSTANINTTNIKNNRSVVVHSPITGTKAPGIYGANGVN